MFDASLLVMTALLSSIEMLPTHLHTKHDQSAPLLFPYRWRIS